MSLKYYPNLFLNDMVNFYNSNCSSLCLLGRVRISPHGLNVTVGGTLSCLESHIEAVKSIHNGLFESTDFKLATCHHPLNDQVAQESGFTSLSIRIVKYLQMGALCFDDNKEGIEVKSAEGFPTSDVPDTDDKFGDPEVVPRVGDQHQAEIPSLITAPYLSQLIKKLRDSDMPESSESVTDEEGQVISENECIKIKVESQTALLGEGQNVGGFSNIQSSSKFDEAVINSHPELRADHVLLPGLLTDQCWTDIEYNSFLLGLYAFGKNLKFLKRFVGSKNMGNILSFYYGKFYRSEGYCRWSRRRKLRDRRGIYGQKIFTGWRQQELLSRLISHVSGDCQTMLVELTRNFGYGKMPFEEYVFALKGAVGIESLVAAVGIGKGKQDLTGTAVKPTKTNHVFAVRPELPIGKACSTLTPADIIKFLTGDFRLSKARSSDLFWGAVWPRLIAKGWHSEQPKDHAVSGSKQSFVFLIPGVKKFSRKDDDQLNLTELRKKTVSLAAAAAETLKDPTPTGRRTRSKTFKKSKIATPEVTQPQTCPPSIPESLPLPMPETIPEPTHEPIHDVVMEPVVNQPTPPPQPIQQPLKAKLRRQIFPYTDPTPFMRQETPYFLRRNWRVLNLTQPPPPEPRPFYPPYQYTYEVEKPLYEPHTPRPYNLITNEHGPLITYLPHKAFPPKKIYPNLILQKPHRPITKGVARHVIPPWNTVPLKAGSANIAEQRSRTYGHKDLIFCKKTEWMKFVHPNAYGDQVTWEDHLAYGIIEAEKKLLWGRRVENICFMPFSWLFISDATKVGVQPTSQCAQLPMLDMNKNKELKFRRKKKDKRTEPQSSASKPPVKIKEVKSNMQQMLNSITEGNEMNEEDASYFWKLHMQRHSVQASSSGLSAAEKEVDSQTVRGQMGFSYPRTITLSCGFVAPISSTTVEEEQIHWLPEPEPAVEVQSDSESSMEEAHPVKQQTSSHGTQAQTDEAGQSDSGPSTSQSLALAVIEKDDSSHISFSQGLSVEETRRLIQSEVQQMKAELEQSVQKQVEASIIPATTMIAHMYGIMQQFFNAQPALLTQVPPLPMGFAPTAPPPATTPSPSQPQTSTSSTPPTDTRPPPNP